MLYWPCFLFVYISSVSWYLLTFQNSYGLFFPGKHLSLCNVLNYFTHLVSFLASSKMIWSVILVHNLLILNLSFYFTIFFHIVDAILDAYVSCLICLEKTYPPWIFWKKNLYKVKLLYMSKNVISLSHLHYSLTWIGGCCYCCQVASVVSDSVRPHRRQPTRLPRSWDSPGKNTGVGCHYLLQCMKVENESEVAQSCPTLSNPMDCSYQVPPSMGFSRQQYWSGVPLPSPR